MTETAIDVFQAIQDANYDLFNKAMFDGIDFREHDAQGLLPLHLAASVGDYQMVDAMLWRGAPVNLPSSQGESALMYAVKKENNVDVIDRLLLSGAKVADTNRSGANVLMMAIEAGHGENAIALLNHRPRLDHEDNKGKTVFDLLVKDNAPMDALRAILSIGDALPVLKKEREDWKNENQERLELIDEVLNASKTEPAWEMGEQTLIINENTFEHQDWYSLTNKEVTGRARTTSRRETKTQEATKKKTVDLSPEEIMVKAIKNNDSIALSDALRKGANPNSICEDGQTPLFIAVKQGQISIVNTLLRNHADPNYQDDNGWTPITYAIMNKAKRGIQTLIPHTNLGLRDKEDRTALHIATAMLAKNLDTTVVIKLAQEYPDAIDMKDENGHTPWTILEGIKKPVVKESFEVLSGRKKVSYESSSRKKENKRQQQPRHTGEKSQQQSPPSHRQQQAKQAYNQQQTKQKSSSSEVSAVAMHEAAMKGDTATLQKLMQKDRQLVNKADASGRTPLMYAAMYHQLQATNVLMEKSYVGAQDSDGRNALMWALSQQDRGNKNQIIGLLAFNAPKTLSARDKDGFTAHDYARALRDPAIEKLLNDAAQYG